MPPNRPQSSYTKKPIRRLRLPKIGLPKRKSLFEEYFYVFLAIIPIVVAILGKAGGLSGYDAIVFGLWSGAILWFAWLARKYVKEKSGGAVEKKVAPDLKTPPAAVKAQVPPGMKPMIGPQWPMKTAPGPRPMGPAQTSPPPPQQQVKKPAFVYERPTLPDRKPKLPNNWAGQQNKKPKQ